MLQRVGMDRPDGVSGAVRFLAEIKMGGQAAGMCHQLEHSNAFFVFGRGEKLFHCIVKGAAALPPESGMQIIVVPTIFDRLAMSYSVVSRAGPKVCRTQTLPRIPTERQAEG